MKKLLIVLIASLIGIPLFCSAKTYDFSHTPANNFKIIKEKEKNGFRYIKYRGSNDEIDPVKVDIDVIQDFVKKRDYFNFIKYSYFWVNMFDQLYDGAIDLRFMDEEVLEYPVIAVYYVDTIYLFIYEGNFDDDMQEVLGHYYESMEMTIVRDQDWYVMQLPVRKKDTDSKNIYRPYSYKRYFPVFKSLVTNEITTNLQIGQNPFDKYTITNFGHEIIQLDVVKDDVVSGIILSIKKLFKVANQFTQDDSRSQAFIKDNIMMGNLDTLYEAVYDYYRNNLALPDSIGSMYPRYLDFTTLNPYNHKIKFESYSQFCFLAGFIPTDYDFKQQYSSMLDSEGYLVKKFCIK